MDFVFDLNTLKTTGIIACPYCGRSKAYVYNNAQESFQACATFVARLSCGTSITRRHIKPERRGMFNNII